MRSGEKHTLRRDGPFKQLVSPRDVTVEACDARVIGGDAPRAPALVAGPRTRETDLHLTRACQMGW